MSPPLRLLLVTHSLAGGGAERFASVLATHLDRDHFAPEVVTATARRAYPVPADVPVTSLGHRGLWTLPRTVRRLRRRLRESRPDVVLSNVLSTNALLGTALRGLDSGPGPPAWVARIGNAPGIGEPALQRRWARRLYPLAAAVVCNSRGAREAFARCYPELAGRVSHLPNPTDFERLDSLAAAPPPETAGAAARLLWVGRLVRQKRPDLAVAAFAAVARRRPARLWLCGEGPLRGAVERQVERLGLGAEVELLGFVDNPFPLMRAAHLMVSTSDFEGLPNSLIEAQGLGLPAVATRCPHGVDEVVEDGTTGRLVAPGDAAALAAAIEELLAGGPASLARLGSAARESARRRFALAAALPGWSRLLATAAGRS